MIVKLKNLLMESDYLQTKVVDDPNYYASLTISLPVQVLDAGQRGRGLFAKQKISRGETILTEEALVCATWTVCFVI